MTNNAEGTNQNAVVKSYEEYLEKYLNKNVSPKKTLENEANIVGAELAAKTIKEVTQKKAN